MTCGASIQDPYIHDSAEDQIAMESGPMQTVVVAPPHLQAAAAAEPEPAELLLDEEIAQPEEDNELIQLAEHNEVKKQAAPFTVLVNGEWRHERTRRPSQRELGDTVGDRDRPGVRVALRCL